MRKVVVKPKPKGLPASGHAEKSQSQAEPGVSSPPNSDYVQPYSQWREESEGEWKNWDWPPRNWRPSPHHRAYWDESSPYYQYNHYDWSKHDEVEPDSLERPSLVRTPSTVSVSSIGPSASLVAAQLQRCSTPEQTCLSPRFDEAGPTESELMMEKAKEERLKAQEMLSEAQLLLTAAKAVTMKKAESNETNEDKTKEKENDELEQAREKVRALGNKFDESRLLHQAAKINMEKDLKRAAQLEASFTNEQQKYAWTYDISVASAHQCEGMINKAAATREQKYHAKRELENASMRLGDMESAMAAQTQEVEETLKDAEGTQVVDANNGKQDEEKHANEAATRNLEELQKEEEEEAERQRAEAAKREEEERQAKEAAARKAEEIKKAEEEEAERQRAEGAKREEEERQAKEDAARKAEEIKKAGEDDKQKAEVAKEEDDKQAKEAAARKAEEIKKAEEAERQRAEAAKREEEERQAKEAAARKAEDLEKARQEEKQKAEVAKQEQEKQAAATKKVQELEKARAEKQKAQVSKEDEKKTKETVTMETNTSADKEKQAAAAMIKKAEQMMKEAEDITKNRDKGGNGPKDVTAKNGELQVPAETPEEKKKREEKEKKKAEHHARYMRYYRNIRRGGPTLGGCVRACLCAICFFYDRSTVLISINF